MLKQMNLNAEKMCFFHDFIRRQNECKLSRQVYLYCTMFRFGCKFIDPYLEIWKRGEWYKKDIQTHKSKMNWQQITTPIFEIINSVVYEQGRTQKKFKHNLHTWCFKWKGKKISPIQFLKFICNTVTVLKIPYTNTYLFLQKRPKKL